MRYVDLDAVLATIPQDKLDKLKRRDNALKLKNSVKKKNDIDKGNALWRPVKEHLEAATNRKCWYTESKNSGFPNEVEHFRPKGRVLKDGNIIHWYWFLAFNPINYRLSSQFPNRLNINPETGVTGGKGDHFPLLTGCNYASNYDEIGDEIPVLLDPCCKEDTELLEFLPDGRSTLSQNFIGERIAEFRVKESIVLLNLNFPTFNEERESLRNKVLKLVNRGDRYIENNSNAIEDVKEDLQELMAPSASYSKAAECYVRGYRDREWVEELILQL